MASRWLVLGCALILQSSIVACGGDDDSGGASLPDSVSRNEQLEDLDEDQVVDLCEAIDDQLADVVSESDATRLSCTLFAAAMMSVGGDGEFDEDACEQAVEDCIDDGGGLGEPTTMSECDADELLASAEGCERTAGELVDCLNANARQVADAVDSITCSTLADDPEALEDAFGEEIAECMDLEDECPEVLGSDGSEGPGGGGDPPASGCEDTCGPDGGGEWAGDGTCDDGGPDAELSVCPLGSDCTDCGER